MTLGAGEAGDEQTDVSGTPLLQAVDAVRDAVSGLRAQLGDDVVWQSSDRTVLTAVGDLARVRAALEEAHLRLVREVDTRGVAEASPVATTPEGFLRTACLMSAARARADVAAARALTPDAPLHPFAALLAGGEVSRAHVDAAVVCLDTIPTKVQQQPGFTDEAVAYLLLAADGGTPTDMNVAAKHLLASLVPDREDRHDERSFDRRFLDLATDASGMTVGRFQLDPVAGAALRTALQRWSAPDPAGSTTTTASQGDAGAPGRRPTNGATDTPGDLGQLRGEQTDAWGSDSKAAGQPDRRQPRQRRADALGHLLQVALGVEAPHRGERPRVVVTMSLDQLQQLEQSRRPGTHDGNTHDNLDHDGCAHDGGPTGNRAAGGGPTVIGLPEVDGAGPIPTWAARTLACDAVLQRLVLSPTDTPLQLGRTVRLASLSQRRALAVRDGGCVIPGCTAPPQVCDAHHLTHWADGGPTDLCNLCLLCPAHHAAVHTGTWTLTTDHEGQIWITPPRHVDPRRQPRPAWHQRARRTRHAA
ncbi:DUF222 domain-containing protein [Jannaschia sp. R86511]|uniref:HNH endonuclease signature motif containing protein n=1 Tax=Jannaschia sp. R86511 TaxID=3093853 RepID=UPI0036D31262